MLVLQAVCAWLSVSAAAATAHHGAGHDIPVVRHSLLKPLLVAYPPRLVPYGVKIPLQAPGARWVVPAPRWPGWSRPVPASPSPHVLSDHHYHHHHHHEEPPPPAALLPARPVLLPAAPAVHVPVPVARPPHHVVPAPVAPVPVAPPLQPVLPAGVALVPVATVGPGARPVVLAPPPLLAPPLHVRPGGSVHASFFATYPRYPFPFPPRGPQQLALVGRPLVAPWRPLVGSGPALQPAQVHEVPELEPGPQSPPLEQQPPRPLHFAHHHHHADSESLYRLQQEYETQHQLSEEYGAPQPQQQHQHQHQQLSEEYGVPQQLSEQYEAHHPAADAGGRLVAEELYPHHLQPPHDS